MPKLLNSVPKYCRHKRSGDAIVHIGGKAIHLGTYGTKGSRARYDAVIAEWLNNQRRPSAPPMETTVSELIQAHMKWARGYYRKNGKQTSQVCLLKTVLRVLRRYYGHLPVSEFGAKKLAAFRDLLAKEPSRKKTKDGAAATTLCRNEINRRVRCVRKMFAWGVEHELTDAEKVAALKLVSPLVAGRCDVREGKTVLPVDLGIVEQTLPHLPPMVADLARIQLATGARPTEVLIMRPMDIDKTTATDLWFYRPSEHKNDHKEGMDRVIVLGPDCQAIIERYLPGVEPHQYIFTPSKSEQTRRAAVSSTRTTPPHVGNRPGSNRVRRPKRSPGDRYTDASYRRCIERACQKANVEKWTPYQLRHAQATRIADRFGLETASQVLGHADIATTRKVYAKTAIGAAAAVAKVMG